MRISNKQAVKLGFFAASAKKNKPKYRNIRVKINGHTFDSKAEAKYYQNSIWPRFLAKEIEDIVIHPRYPLIVEGVKICTVVFDFEYTVVATGNREIDDVKGADNEKSKRKRQHFEAQYGRKVNLIKAYEG